jgi:hypothetical protein
VQRRRRYKAISRGQGLFYGYGNRAAVQPINPEKLPPRSLWNEFSGKSKMKKGNYDAATF